MKKYSLIILVLFLMSGCNSGSGSAAGNTSPEKPTIVPFWEVKNSGGEGTSKDNFGTSHAFSYPMTNLNSEDLALHLVGDGNFERKFSDDPVNFPNDFGLGPVQNNTSCIACHNRDGRGSLPVGVNDKTWLKMGVNEALFLRISIENDEILNAPKNMDNHFGAPQAVPGFATQLFHTGSRFLRPASQGDGLAEVWIKLEKSSFTYPDGKVVALSKPIFEVRNAYDQWVDEVTGKPRSRLDAADVHFSPRMGMPMFGLGLLENIPVEDLIANAKIDRSDEGIYGKVNMVFDVVKYRNGDIYPVSVGRFGLKANTPSIEQQALGALNGDIGVTNYLFPEESIIGTPLFNEYQKNNPMPLKIEANESVSKSLVFYSQSLAVPPRRNIDNPDVISGAKLFQKINCTACHTPSWTTGEAKIAALSRQKITPYTDLLLHDMGEGLADYRQDFEADGRQWKTRPLWGIGLTKVVNPRAGFLHDGRANTIEEAILWHDGEGQLSRDRFANLSSIERDQLIKFIESL